MRDKSAVQDTLLERIEIDPVLIVLEAFEALRSKMIARRLERERPELSAYWDATGRLSVRERIAVRLRMRRDSLARMRARRMRLAPGS